jgi:hypothetical protein
MIVAAGFAESGTLLCWRETVSLKNKPFKISYTSCLSVRPLVFGTIESGVISWLHRVGMQRRFYEWWY